MHARHCRRRRMTRPASLERESMTLPWSSLQKGHLTTRTDLSYSITPDSSTADNSCFQTATQHMVTPRIVQPSCGVSSEICAPPARLCDLPREGSRQDGRTEVRSSWTWASDLNAPARRAQKRGLCIRGRRGRLGKKLTQPPQRLSLVQLPSSRVRSQVSLGSFSS